MLQDATLRTAKTLDAVTGSLEYRLKHKEECLAAAVAKVKAEVDAQYTRHLALRCLLAMMEPVRWKRAVRLSNRWEARATHGALPHRAPSTRCAADLVHRVWHRWKLRRMIRICRRLVSLDERMPDFYRLKVLHPNPNPNHPNPNPNANLKVLHPNPNPNPRP